MRNFFRRCKYWVVRNAATAYISGPEIQDAIYICKMFSENGWSSSICPWNSEGDPIVDVANSYINSLEAIAREQFDCYLSIKVPALGYDFNLLSSLLELASQYDIRIHFDAQTPETATPTFQIIEKAVARYRNLGCTLPSCWARSTKDAELAIDLGISVRVVKGQWKDPVDLNIKTNANYLDIIDVLAGKAKHVSVATHDIPLAKESIIRLLKSNTCCELEQLYGLPFRINTVATPLNVKVRGYVPYGSAFLSYAVDEAFRKPIIMYWLLKDLIRGEKIIKLKRGG